MSKLYLVGITEDRTGLVLARSPRAKSGDDVLEVDPAVLEAIAEVRRFRAEGGGTPAVSSPALPARRGEQAGAGSRDASRLTPREIQSRLRRGESVPSVARRAGVEEWRVEIYAAPIVAEQARVIGKARQLVLDKRGSGPSGRPLGEAVLAGVVEKGVSMYAQDFESAWSAYEPEPDRWVVRFRYVSRGREQVAEWHYDPADETVTAANRLGTVLGWRDPKRPGRIPPLPEAPARSSEESAAPTSKRSSRKSAGKKSAGKKPVTKKPAAKKPAAKKPATKKSAAKKQPAKKPAAKKPAPKKPEAKTAATKKSAAKKKPAPKKPEAKTAATKKSAAKKPAAKKQPGKKSAAKKPAAKKQPEAKQQPEGKKPPGKTPAATRPPSTPPERPRAAPPTVRRLDPDEVARRDDDTRAGGERPSWREELERRRARERALEDRLPPSGDRAAPGPALDETAGLDVPAWLGRRAATDGSDDPQGDGPSAGRGRPAANGRGIAVDATPVSAAGAGRTAPPPRRRRPLRAR